MGLPQSPELVSVSNSVSGPDSRLNFFWPSGCLQTVKETRGPVLADDVEDDFTQIQHADPLEASSYAPLQSYLISLNFDAVIVANGHGLPNGLLFSQYAYSMRKDKTSVRGQEVLVGMRVHGRTDVVILDKEGQKGVVSRHRVLLAIEVKPAVKDVDALSPSSRKAMAQLIGLNINNMQHSPPVLLTNLKRVHWVYYIIKNEIFPWYRIARTNFSTFIDALRFVESLWKLDTHNYEFGREPSPSAEDISISS